MCACSSALPPNAEDTAAAQISTGRGLGSTCRRPRQLLDNSRTSWRPAGPERARVSSNQTRPKPAPTSLSTVRKHLFLGRASRSAASAPNKLANSCTVPAKATKCRRNCPDGAQQGPVDECPTQLSIGNSHARSATSRKPNPLRLRQPRQRPTPQSS